MRLKEIQRTAQQAWSPAGHHPICLALGTQTQSLRTSDCIVCTVLVNWARCDFSSTGTSAQQLDASFNTTAALEIFELDFADPSLDMKLRGSLCTTNR